MRLSDMRVGVKLGLAFAAMALLNLVLGGLAVVWLGHVNEDTREIANKWLPSVQALGDMRATANRLRASEIGAVLGSDPQLVPRLREDVAAVGRLLGEAEQRYAPMVAPSEAPLYAEFKNHRDAYLRAQARLMEMVADESRRAEAAHMLYGESQKTFINMAETIGKLSRASHEGSQAAYAESQQTFGSARGSVIAVLAVVIAAAIALGLWITRLVTRPVAHAVQAAREIAQGNLAASLSVHGRDELGQLTQALVDMQANLARVVSDVRANAESVATASAQIAQGNGDLSARTESQASALQETAASMEQLGATVRQNADNAAQANQLAMSASTVAAQGGEVVSEVVDTMRGINDASHKIADIIGVIDGIAFQTNILALNAAVEAARAGEQGRGFAVVAGEVRSLAQRSAEAAKEIKQLITASVERVEQGTQLVDKAGETMTEVVGAIRRVTDIVGEISAASSEQSSGVAQVGEAITQMDQATQRNAALVEESAAAASSLKAQAAQLVQAVAVFRLAQGGGGAIAPRPSPAAAVPAAAPQPRVAAPAPAPKAAPPRKPAAPAPNAAAPAAQRPRLAVVPKNDDDWESF
ncbi:HAMP domain-containing protein [Alicycliphilus denitrificans]|uniref:HAMP domain-containing protein n=2 Tax=Alicycliphilus denitrificans TaxID=179636 RepID=A0A858ZS61_9BURK|nr:methyl-accepting chemotaxis protein [Alicycliphilus denitrificans]ADU99502.1 chemotaxis sensory transducer [Alicycliphilus denitrificans BC]QKD43705.1 HAMP domain-containing protein [Alicycliphilus denitrificans]GAO22769.1 methyl-accepting chemotaxis sensory transducer [Alicycliphilus sp. B1]